MFARPQGEEIVRRCLYGYSPELALQTSNPIKIPPGKGGKPAGSGSVRITSEHVRNLKHDVEFIKKAHDLRDVGEGKKGKGNAKVAPPRYRRLAAWFLRSTESMVFSHLRKCPSRRLIPC